MRESVGGLINFVGLVEGTFLLFRRIFAATFETFARASEANHQQFSQAL